MRTAFFTGIIAALALAAACDKKSDSGKTATVAPSHTAKARGVVKHIATGPKATSLTINHEAIPDWVNSRGKKTPMMAMAMEFQAGPKLDIGGLAIGDKIAFEVAVYYGADNPRIEVTSFEKLPADTALELAGH